MKKHFLFLLSLPVVWQVAAQNPQAYQLFDGNGNAVQYNVMIDSLLQAEVAFFGELHDNPIAHWMQLQVTRDLHAKKKDKLVLGAEMFEADNQLLIDEYLDSTISERSFEQEARLWPNHKTDYKPLLSFAKKHHLKFIATNIPRRYANLVYRKGLKPLKSLTPEAQSWMAPLPIKTDLEQPAYAKMREMANGHGGENLLYAQAIKDATMAYFIHKNRTKKSLFLHYNGAYHSDDRQGIVWYLEQYAPGTKVVTFTTVSQSNLKVLDDDNKGKADFILCVPADMTSTY